MREQGKSLMLIAAAKLASYVGPFRQEDTISTGFRAPWDGPEFEFISTVPSGPRRRYAPPPKSDVVKKRRKANKAARQARKRNK